MTVKEPEQVRVVAPSTLNAGYTFDVTTADGRTLTVKVPTGGVTEGQSFDAEVVDDIKSSATNPNFVAVMAVPATAPVLDAEPETVVAGEAIPVATSITAVGEPAPTITKTVIKNPDGTEIVTEETRYPDGRITTTTTTLADATTTGGGGTPLRTPPSTFAVPTGAWRYDLFSCCDTCSSGMFWMAWCCAYAALGQILQRMKLNCCGSKSSGSEYKNSCMLWTVLMIVMWVITFILMPYSENASIIIIYAMSILAVFAMTQARYYMRQKYSIPADCCSDSGCLSDCCCMWWCSCCGLIQMMRHTHDERKYVYNCTSPTGLHADVPEIV
jgi:Cys-rich protein (TIGR01571 family)